MATDAIEAKIKQTTGMTTADLREFAKRGDLHWTAVIEVTEARRLVTGIERELRELIDAARHNLDQAEHHLATGHYTSQVDILKSRVLRIDQLAVRRDDAYHRLNAACQIVAAVAATKPA